MARCLVKEDVQNVTCYDPSAGSGTLLMNLAHEIGEDSVRYIVKIYRKNTSNLLRLIDIDELGAFDPEYCKGNTIHSHTKGRRSLRLGDYIVSNPPLSLISPITEMT